MFYFDNVCLLNECAKKKGSCKVTVLDIDGVDYLLYQAPKPNYALIRASISDENANLSMEDEGLRGTVLSIAQAAKARPYQGRVIAQVRWLTKYGTINPRDVDVPGPLSLPTRGISGDSRRSAENLLCRHLHCRTK